MYLKDAARRERSQKKFAARGWPIAKRCRKSVQVDTTPEGRCQWRGGTSEGLASKAEAPAGGAAGPSARGSERGGIYLGGLLGVQLIVAAAPICWRSSRCEVLGSERGEQLPDRSHQGDGLLFRQILEVAPPSLDEHPMGTSSEPLFLIFEFARVKDGGDPYAFEFSPQEYLLRSTTTDAAPPVTGTRSSCGNGGKIFEPSTMAQSRRQSP